MKGKLVMIIVMIAVQRAEKLVVMAVMGGDGGR